MCSGFTLLSRGIAQLLSHRPDLLPQEFSSAVVSREWTMNSTEMLEGSIDSNDESPARALPLVAIVGRPNVGKSTLFNRLTGERRAIVGDEPGITRDRIYGEAQWTGQTFSVVDTGGIVPDDDAVIPANILKQASFAIEEAQALIWVVDARKGLTPLDEELAKLLRATGKRVLVAANKLDSTRLENEGTEFYRFGFDEVFAVSAEQGIGVAELLDELVAGLEETGGQGQREKKAE